MAVKNKASKADRLEAIRNKLKSTDTGGGGKGFFSPKQGRSVIRILPEVGNMEYFFQEVGKHQFPGNKYVYCPKFTSAGKLACPVCELVRELYSAGDNASKKLAKNIKLRRMYWMNVINRGDEDSGPLVYTPGVRSFDQISTIIGDPDYGDITDVAHGVDLKITRKGTGIDTDYQINASPRETPLSDDQDLIDQWLEEAKDLSWVEVSDDQDEDAELSKGYGIYVLPYDRIVREFGLDDVDVDAMLSSDDDNGGNNSEDDEEEKPVRKSAPKSRRVVEDDDDEEEDDDTYDKDDDEEEDEPVNRRSPKEEVRRRARSRRR